MQSLEKAPDYVRNPDVPHYRCYGLYDLDFMISDGIFEMYKLARTPGGVLYRETAFFVEMPVVSIPPGVALVTRKLASAVLTPVITVFQSFGLH